MKNSIWWMLLPVPVVLAVAGVFYVLFPERILGELTMLASVLLVSLSAGTVVFSLISGRTGTGSAGHFGIGTIMAGLLLVASSASVSLAIAGIGKGAMALNVVTLAGFLATFVIVRATSSSRPSSKPDTRSSEIIWAERLENIGRSCGMYQLKTRLLRLAGETRFLAHDQGMVAAEINLRISSALDTVSDAVQRGDEQLATMQLKRLRNLFSERESELTAMRNR